LVALFVVLEVDADGVRVLLNVGLVWGRVVARDRLRPAVVYVLPRCVEVAARVLRRGGGVVSESLCEVFRVFGRARDLLLHELLYVWIGHEVWIVTQVYKLLRSLFRHLPTSKVPARFPPEERHHRARENFNCRLLV